MARLSFSHSHSISNLRRQVQRDSSSHYAVTYEIRILDRDEFRWAIQELAAGAA